MELDKRLPHYAKIISKDADILLSEDCNLTDLQRDKIIRTKRNVELLMTFYHELVENLRLERDEIDYLYFVSGTLHSLRIFACHSFGYRYIINERTSCNHWSGIAVDAWVHLQQYAMLLEDTINSCENPKRST